MLLAPKSGFGTLQNATHALCPNRTRIAGTGAALETEGRQVTGEATFRPTGVDVLASRAFGTLSCTILGELAPSPGAHATQSQTLAVPVALVNGLSLAHAMQEL